MSLSIISSELNAAQHVAAPKTSTAPVPTRQAPVAAQADTLTVSPAAQKLQTGDVDSDGDSH